MQIEFYKYQGAGNDFVMIDNRLGAFCLDEWQIRDLCCRRFGIGADGLILIESDLSVDFLMHYYNADGKLGSMCGNGARCAVAFVSDLGIPFTKGVFRACDGIHTAEILNDLSISISMSGVDTIKPIGDDWLLDTGSPHHICFVENVASMDVKSEGARIRYSDVYKDEGVNVNFVEFKADTLLLRTYERGVEDETLACGTGATATAIAAYEAGMLDANNVVVDVLGGRLHVKFEKVNSVYTNVVLTGPAKFVFKGSIDV